jgi:hypothetical protein
VVHPGDQDQLAARDGRGGRLVRQDQRREVGVADEQRRRHRDLAEAVEDGRIFLFQVANAQRGAGGGTELVHRVRGGAGPAPDALGDAGHRLDVTGGLGALVLTEQAVGLARIVLAEREPGDAGAEQHQRRHPLGLLHGEPERAGAALAAADDRRPLDAVVAEHRLQVAQQRVLHRRGGGLAEAPRVVPDHPVLRRQRGQHRVPDPRVADTRVEQHQRRAVTLGVVRPHRAAIHFDHRRSHTAHHWGSARSMSRCLPACHGCSGRPFITVPTAFLGP